MIKLYHFGPHWGLDDASPFCAKLITYLKLRGIAFESLTGIKHLRGAPKAKLPVIDDDGRLVCDSNFIIDYLEERHGSTTAAAPAAERAAAHAMCRMLEEHLYWAIVYGRWMVEQNWTRYTRPAFFDKLPWPARKLVPVVLQKKLRRTLYAQGLGRHSHDEIMQLGRRDIEALAGFLAQRDFMLGADPSRYDATVFGFLEALVVPPHESALKDQAMAQPSLTAYRERMRARTAPG